MNAMTRRWGCWLAGAVLAYIGRTLTYSGSTGVGGPDHLRMERLAQLSGAKLLFVP